MLSQRRRLLTLTALFALTLAACKNINEATELGGELIPTVDNITTFAEELPVVSNLQLYNDTTRLLYTQQVALGALIDPLFGTTKADLYFNVAPSQPGFNPFVNKDSVIAIDSVVLSLSYLGANGDTLSPQQITVSEISQTSGFSSDSLYMYNRAPFATAGVLGSKLFTYSQLNDSVQLIRGRDTGKVANVLRIRLSNSLGDRFKTYDTSATSLTAGFRNDSAFYKQFRGLALTSTSGGANALGYFSLSDQQKTSLIVYFQRWRNGKRDTTSTALFHLTNGQANPVQRTPANGYAAALANPGPDPTLFIQSTPGSLAKLFVPGLTAYPNRIIHLAELITYRDPATVTNFFNTPARLYLDRINTGGDSASVLLKDYFDQNNSVSAGFAGSLRGDGSYRFNMTRHVQDITTRRLGNDTLRLFAPLSLTYRIPGVGQVPVTVNNLVANGRVVVAGGSYPDPALRMRLRIVYSNIR